MLGTHSEPCRGEMSHICDISLLRVNTIGQLEMYTNKTQTEIKHLVDIVLHLHLHKYVTDNICKRRSFPE